VRIRAAFGKGKPKPRVAGQQSAHEVAFEEHLRARLGKDVLWFKYESMNLKLADGTYYKPDFVALHEDHVLVCYEVKPGRMVKGELGTIITDGAAVKLKVASEHYPLRFVLVTAHKALVRDGAAWSFKLEDV
jgi:hypothetical protein